MDFRQNGQGFPRATNNVPLVGLGDPERWGGVSNFIVSVGAPAGTYVGRGKEIVRAQTPDLLARGWALSAHFSATVLDTATPDEPHYYVDVMAGTGQNTHKITLDLLQIARNTGWTVLTLNSGTQPEDGSCILPSPIVGSSISIVPWGSVFKRVGGVLDHDARFQIEIQIAPWSLG